MTDEQLITAVCNRMGTRPSFAGELLRAMACAKREVVFKQDALGQATVTDRLAFQHQAMGRLLGVDYAQFDAWTIAQAAGAAFEEGNYHPEAAAVREMGFASTDTVECS